MADRRPSREHRESARQASRSAYETAVDVVVTGFAVIIPLVITLYILEMAFNVVAALQPFVGLLNYLGVTGWVRQTGLVDLVVGQLRLFPSASAFISEITAAVVLVVVIVGVGVVARNTYGESLIDVVDSLIVAIPGVGTVYKSFRRMTDVMMESDAQNFREVKLVEFPRDGTCVIGFETNDSPEVIREAAGVEGGMRTLFLPLAPNPVMGGFLSHVPDERVYDVDMTVEEGIRSIVTSGVAVDADGDTAGVEPIETDHVREVLEREWNHTRETVLDREER
ncbi:MAG: DUF502 domain-containing protein [Halobacteriaceae archaeon]